MLMGIDDEGNKEILDFSLYSSERTENDNKVLQDLKQQVLLFVSDGLVSLPEAVTDVCLKLSINVFGLIFIVSF